MTAKKKTGKWGQWIGVLVSMAIGGLSGIMMVRAMDHIKTDSPWMAASAFVLLLLAMYAAMFLQIIIHEAGHLLFGLMTGYRFSSFRVGSMMWIEQDGKIVRRRFSLAGTGGQCLMIPPDMQDGKIPFVLYNLGGSLVNLGSALLFWGASALCGGVPVLQACLEMMAIIGVAFAAMNGIPLHMGSINNDGCNALELGKDPAALRSFWVQMKVNELQTRGLSVKDMPEAWFVMPDEEAMGNAMTAVMGVLVCSRLMAEHRFEEADGELARLLAADTAIVGLHRNCMVCDRIACACIAGRAGDALALCTPQVTKFMKGMKTFPAVLRTRYALALAEGDAAAAEKTLDAFEKAVVRYPYPTDAQEERVLMACIREGLEPRE